jgi:hypothetical protein
MFSRVQPLEFRSKLVLIFFLKTSLEEVSWDYEAAVCAPTGAELVEVLPAGATLVGLMEDAPAGVSVVVVVESVEVAEPAAAEASLQLALHRKSDSFCMEARIRYHHISQSCASAVWSTYHFHQFLLATSSSFYDAQLSTLLCHPFGDG